jgi:predicted Zn-dependent peptidase
MRIVTLKNGLRVLLLPQPHLKSACFGLWVASGSVFETAENNGVSHFIEHIVFKGSTARTALEIAKQTDRLGASLNAYTSKEFTHFYTRAPGENITAAAEILLDMVLHPRLDENDIETEKGVILEEIGMCEDDPADLCYELAESSLFNGTPYALQILGTRESVRRTDRAKFLLQLARCYTARRMVIGVGGAFDEAAVLGLIERFCAGLPAGDAAAFPPLSCRQGIYRKQAQFEQTHLMLTAPGTALWHPDRFALQTVLFLLGTGASSRLNQRIREQLGLVYQIDAWAGRFVSGGYLAVSLSLSGENQRTALAETCSIIRDLPDSITQEELDIAKAKLTSGLLMNREQPHAALAAFGVDLLLRGEITEDEALLQGVRSVTLQQAKDAAARYLDPDAFSLTAVGAVQSEAFYGAILKGDESR